MIEYFHYFDYLRAPAPASDHTSAPPKSFLVEHARVFAMATKYQADGLRQLAAHKFKETASKDWNHEDFAHTVHVVYTSTSDNIIELRQIVADTIHDHLEDLKDKEEVETVISGLGGLAYSLLKRRCRTLSCTREHGGDALPLVVQCLQSTCRHSFSICRQCHSGRRMVYCPFCGNNVSLP